jgi:hypothetical protein
LDGLRHQTFWHINPFVQRRATFGVDGIFVRGGGIAGAIVATAVATVIEASGTKDDFVAIAFYINVIGGDAVEIDFTAEIVFLDNRAKAGWSSDENTTLWAAHVEHFERVRGVSVEVSKLKEINHYFDCLKHI